MSSPLRIALIGAGNMGQQHYHHLKTLAEARLCAVADPGPQAAEVAAQWQVPHYADHRQMLAESRPDGVIVANPNNLHVSTALDCLAPGTYPALLGNRWPGNVRQLQNVIFRAAGACARPACGPGRCRCDRRHTLSLM